MVLPIPGLAIAILLNTTAVIPVAAAFLEIPSRLFSSSKRTTPFRSSLLKFSKGKYFYYFTLNLHILTYCNLIIGTLIQLAAETAANGTSLPISGFKF